MPLSSPLQETRFVQLINIPSRKTSFLLLFPMNLSTTINFCPLYTLLSMTCCTFIRFLGALLFLSSYFFFWILENVCQCSMFSCHWLTRIFLIQYVWMVWFIMSSSLNKNDGLTNLYNLFGFWNSRVLASPLPKLTTTTTTITCRLASQILMNGWNMPISSANPLSILQVCYVISCIACLDFLFI